MLEKNLLLMLKSKLYMQNTVLKMTDCNKNDIYHDIGDRLFVAKCVMYDDDVIEFYAKCQNTINCIIWL